MCPDAHAYSIAHFCEFVKGVAENSYAGAACGASGTHPVAHLGLEKDLEKNF